MGATEMTSGEAASQAGGDAGAGSAPGAAFDSKTRVPYQPRIRWLDLFVQIFLHAGFLYGFWLTLTAAKLATTIWALAVVVASGVGITAGAHRLWSHRAYRAKWPLRLLLAFLFTIAGQRHVYQWALDHRVHHKFSETDADPHDARRGFLFSHVGWLVLTPHPAVTENRAKVDMSDLEADPIVMWQKRLYVPLFALLVVVFPVWVPWYFWDETLWRSFFVLFNFRFVLTLNIAFLINSVAHMWGNRPYDKHISPVENAVVSVAALGEGWHNYHHVFPWDYKAAELGNYRLNFTTAFIDFFAWLGWAYDLKTVPERMALSRAARTGDGSHERLQRHAPHSAQPGVWGWGDPDMPAEEVRDATIVRHAL